MVKILNSGSNDMLLSSEQYNDCSNLLMKAADEPPLEELDPAILSCGLPAIILSDIKPVLANHIRYTVNQLLALRNSILSNRRPAVVDDPKIGNFRIWLAASQSKGTTNANRSSNSAGAGATVTVNKDDYRTDRGNNKNNFNVSNPIRHEKRQQYQDRQRNFNDRDTGFMAPRFRRQYEFSNRQHHVIVKSYRGHPDYNNHCLQDTVIEEEPEWVSAGPTSRLETIELRGFDDDVSPPELSTSQSSLEKATSGILIDSKAGSRNSSSEKHISFYDDLHHYEHIHAKQRGGSGAGASKLLDSSGGRDHDVESVAASNTSSPPPARSTPTKPSDYGSDGNAGSNGVNVNNFEEFMKFDSFLGPENSSNNYNNNMQPGSRFSKWFRRGNNPSANTSGGNYHNNGYGGDRRQSSYYSGYNSYNNYDNFGGNQNYRYQYDRNQQQQQQQYHQQQHRFQTGGMGGARSYSGAYEQHLTADSNVAFKRLVDMVAQNRASNNMLAQQQYLMQLLNKNQQTEILRRMIMKNAVDNVSESNGSSQQQQQQQQEANQQQSQQPRVPTQRELQFHTQSIMQNALLRKKLQDQRKMLFDQSNQIAAVAAVAAATSVASEPNPIVQQFVQSVCPNIQRSLSVLCQTATGAAASQMNQAKFGTAADRDNSGEMTSHQGTNNPSMFPGGQTQHELSASLQQMLQQGPQQRSESGSSSSAANGQRQGFAKGRSVTWNSSVN